MGLLSIFSLRLRSGELLITGLTGIKKLLSTLGVMEASMIQGRGCLGGNRNNGLVFLNGSIAGIHPQPKKLTTQLRALRRVGRALQYSSSLSGHHGVQTLTPS